MYKKIALVTGASRGIGNTVAKRLIDNGAHVIAVARTIGALEELDDYARASGNSITIVPLDISEFEKIDELGFNIYNRFGRLDIFVGNAGMLGGCYPVAHYNPKNWQKIIDVNLTANWRFIRSFDSLLRLSENGRVVFVTTPIAQNNDAYYGAYAASKAGLEALAKVYANESLQTNIKVNLLSLENINTRLHKEAFKTDSNLGLLDPGDIVHIFEKLISESQKETGKIYKMQEELTAICH